MNNIRAQFRKLFFEEPFSIKKAGGQTNRNFIVTVKTKKFFVRFPWERGDIVDRTAEGRNIRAIAQNKALQKITPRFLTYILGKKNILNKKDSRRYDVPDGTMVSEFVDGREFTFTDFSKPTYQRKLVQMFRVFHVSGVRFANTYNVFRDEIKKYKLAAKKYNTSKFADSKTVALLEQIEKEAEQALPVLREGISTHNDFIFQNFLVDKRGKMYLLDFEYAGFNKKGGIAYDFGFLFADNLFRKPAMTPKLFERFLDVVDKAYKKKLNRTRIYWAALAALLVQFWWGQVRYFSVESAKEKRYFKQYVQERMQGVMSLFQYLRKEKRSLRGSRRSGG